MSGLAPHPMEVHKIVDHGKKGTYKKKALYIDLVISTINKCLSY